MEIFYNEHSPLQLATAILLLLASLTCAHSKWRPDAYFVSFGLTWLALDEVFYFHECFKVTFLQGIHSLYYRDTLPLVYLLIGVLFVSFNFFKIKERSDLLIIISAIGVLALTSVLVDVFGFFENFYPLIIEEVSEIGVAVLFLIYSLKIEKRKFATVIFLRALGLATLLSVIMISFWQGKCSFLPIEF